MIVIKVGGNAIWPRDADGIHLQLMESLFAFVRHLVRNEQETVVLVPGGVGGQHFIEWARRVGCSETEMNAVGCTLINMAAFILNSYFLNNSAGHFQTCPIVVDTFAQLRMHADRYNLLVAGVILPGALTSDSLAALTAEHLGAKLLIIKSSYPYTDEQMERVDNDVRVIHNRELIDRITQRDTPFRAGYHASLDYVCLKVLERARLEAAILSSDDLVAWHSGASLNVLHIKS